MEDSIKQDVAGVIPKFFANIFNVLLLLTRPRIYCHFRWGSSFTDAFQYINEYAPHQFVAIYGRISARYKYHPLQQNEQKIRKFDLEDSLAGQLAHFGNRAFYDAVLSPKFISDGSSNSSRSFDADLTKLEDVSTVSTSADLVYNHARFIYKDENDRGTLAKLARETYLAGFSRPVDAFDKNDWENLRTELRKGDHRAPSLEDVPDQKTLAVALSYKGNETQITRRIRLVNDQGKPIPDENERKERETQALTDDFLDDFRWSQVVRTCKGLARQKELRYVRIWVDRLISMGLSEDDNSARNEKLDWEDYGLFPYAVCPVVRVYQKDEVHFGTDFWRKLEAVLGVAGHGLMVDDYMLRKYDNTIYFASSMYQRLDHGVSLIGGGGQYFRSITLALATSILTDGVSVSAVNEDIRTRDSVTGWKAWALRTIAEGAYSEDHSCMMRKEPDFEVHKREFMTLAFWESLVVACKSLKGQSYLDTSYQRYMSWKKSSCWNGILEWIGMIPGSCLIEDQDEINKFLDDNVQMEVWTAPSGHVAAWLQLTMDQGKFHRSLVVDLARFSMITEGHVTAVAEATGLRGKSLLPRYLRFNPIPDADQQAKIENRELNIEYKTMKVELVIMPYLRLALAAIPVSLIFASIQVTFLIGFAIVIGLFFGLLFLFWSRLWLWYDNSDVGEALFDNLILHSIYNSGIKLIYRKLRNANYSEIGWTGVDWRASGQKRAFCGISKERST